jgi:methyl-accepting chemotaxis protein
MNLRNLKIGAKLGVTFTLLFTLLTALAGSGIWLLSSMAGKVDYMLDDAIAKDRIVKSWSHATELNATRTYAAARSNNADNVKALELQISQTSKAIADLRKQLDSTIKSETGKALYQQAAAQGEAYRAARAEVFTLKDSGDKEGALALLSSKLEPALNAYVRDIGKLAQHQNKKADEAAAQVRQQSRIGLYVMTALCLGSLAIGTIGAILVTRSITRPLREAIHVAEAVARGDLTSQIEITTRDESGQLLEALSTMNEKLVAIVSEVRSGTDLIATASSEIATGNLDLSSRTEQQAGALEETASSMEELTATVRQNADNAAQAQQLAVQASEVASKSGAAMNQVIGTMGEINNAAGRIVDIISVIDGIAFQTNILALNAAVEAARAGEQGRGFAVVASEVRTLAQRSATASKEIKELINDSVEKVGAGTRLVDSAGQTIGELAQSVQRVTRIIGEITDASREQSAGIEQINEAVTQMDHVTQQNAALVEEAAAAADSLRTQADTLQELVSVFKLSAQGGRQGNVQPFKAAKGGTHVARAANRQPARLAA